MSFQVFANLLNRLTVTVKHKKRVHSRAAGCEQLESRLLMTVDAILVKDINTVPNNTESNPQKLTEVNGTVFFTAQTLTGGYELWKSDGTSTGTVQVKDIWAGTSGSNPNNLTNVNGTLYFGASDSAGGAELWKSDGTSTGTVQVKDIFAGTTGSLFGFLTNVNGTLYFSARDSDGGNELWKSDGTAAGTIQVKDIFTGTSGSNPNNLTNVNGTLYFTAFTSAGGEELWKSDGTSTGTVQVKDISAGTSNSYPRSLTNVNGILYFSALDSDGGYELWKSDGTSTGTVQVKDIVAGTSSSFPRSLTNVNGTLYFNAYGGAGGWELWKSDGTSMGTVQVKDISAGISDSYPHSLTNVNGTLYFSAFTSAGGGELWKSDGTSTGTVQVKDISAGSSSSSPNNLTNINGTLYFRAFTGAGGYELWKSDGTSPGTVQVKDISAGTSSSSPNNLTNVNGTLYFNASDSAGGAELWKSDGTSPGTVQVKDISAGTSSSSPTNLTNINGTLYFRAFTSAGGYELWKSDGTSPGTVQVKDISAGTSSSYPTNLTNVDGTLYFTARDSAGGYELWRSDGTSTGTIQVKDIWAGPTGSIPQSLTNVNGMLYFTARDSAGGFELWKSDGTSTGTVQVKDIDAGPSDSIPRSLTNVNGTLYFDASSSTGGRELWKSDGTSTGTIQVKDIFTGPTGSFPVFLTNVNGTLYFRARDSAGGHELWKSDGTSTGTVQVKDIYAGTNTSDPRSLTNVNGTLYFRALESAGGYELWKSDGTSPGTVQVKDISAGTSSSSPSNLTNVNGTLYFTASDNAGGNELWKSDGTSMGTVQVKDIYAGTNGSNPFNLTNVNGTLYFTASDSAGGVGLWKSDGTSEGTVRVADNLVLGSYPSSITEVDGRVFFSAESDESGRELWTLSDSPEITTNTLTITEGATVVLGTAQINASDADNSPAQLTYTASGISQGQFELTSAPGVPIISFTQAQINSGSVVFVHDGGEASPAYSLIVSDGTATSDVSVAAISFTNTNDGPVILVNTLTIAEGATVVLGTAQINASDPDNSPAQLAFTASGISQGQFELTSAPGVPVTSFTQAQINSGSVVFVHDGGEAAPTYSLTVSDGTATSDLSVAAISFTNINDGPVILVNTLTIAEGATVVLGNTQINASDADNSPAQLTFTASGISQGQFELTSAPGVSITSFTQAQIDSGSVVFVHDGGEAAPAYSLTVSDGTATSDVSVSAISFTNTNDGPVILVNTLTIAEGATVVLGNAQINASDPDNTPAQLTYAARGISQGQFELTSAPGVPVTSFTQAQINSGSVVFVHDGGEAAPAYSLTVSDGTATSDVSVASISFTNTNDGPVILVNTLTIAEGATVVLGAANINASDPDNSPAQLTFTANGISQGQFELTSAPGVPITSFTQAQINSGSVAFVHDGGESAPAYSLTVSDGTATSDLSVALISFTNTNDGPVILVNTLTIAEGATVVLGTAQINTSDADNSPAQLTYTASGVSQGQFELTSAPGVPITSFTQAQINSGSVVFVHDGGEAAPAYWLTVSDGTVTSDVSVASISFTNANDGPVILVNTLTIAEGTTVVLGTAQINAFDADNSPAQLTYTVSGISQGRFELTSAPGVPITSFTQAQINSGSVVFVHNGGEAAPAYSLTVSDGTATSGVSVASVNFTNLNDVPVAANGTLSTTQNVAKNGTLVVNDPDHSPAQLTISIVGLPSHGTVLITNIHTGAYTYTPANGYFGTDSFTFKANDGTADSNLATVSITVGSAVAFVPPPPVIIDNASGSATYSETGSWKNKAGQGPTGYLGNLRYANPNATTYGANAYDNGVRVGSPGQVEFATSDVDTASFTFTGLAAGTYRVAVTYAAGSNRATNAMFTVAGSGVSSQDVFVNQKVTPSDFNVSGFSWKILAASFGVVSDNGTITVTLSSAGANGYVIADAVRIQQIAPLEAAAGPAASPVSQSLADRDLKRIVKEGISRWEATGLSSDQLAILRGVQFQITNLPGAELGGQAGNLITLDSNAAGYGWFVDSTPKNDREFETTDAATELTSQLGSPAVGKMDLLTVVMHELGHVLGLQHDADDAHLMDGQLETGVRHILVGDQGGRPAKPAKPARLETGGKVSSRTNRPETEELPVINVSSNVSVAADTGRQHRVSRVTSDSRRSKRLTQQAFQVSKEEDQFDLDLLFATVLDDRIK